MLLLIVCVLCVFLSTLSLRRATRRHRRDDGSPIHFYPRSPCGERLFLLRKITITVDISIHALLAESDYDTSSLLQCQVKFLSTLSLRRATMSSCTIGLPCVFLSTLSLRRATVHYDNYNLHCVISIHALLAESDSSKTHDRHKTPISIHALLAESDPSKLAKTSRTENISIHALLAESDQASQFKPPVKSHNFYPRSPCGERRESQQPSARPTTDFYPRSPCGERLISDAPSSAPYAISIHALLAESDPSTNVRSSPKYKFLSTLSLRRATTLPRSFIRSSNNFYPRSPCGERLIRQPTPTRNDKFLSTLSLRRATRSHSGDDSRPIYFYPRSPCGERQI